MNQPVAFPGRHHAIAIIGQVETAAVAGSAQDIAKIKATLARLEPLVVQLVRDVARIDGRVEVQSRTLQALVPTRIAAVPPAAE